MSELFQESIFKEPPSAEVLLDLWLDYGSSADRDPIGLKGEPSYRYFWSTWTKYLKTGRNAELPAPIEWHAVTSEDVVGFLTSGPESRKEDTQVSDITRRRYWRLLERIYDFALQQGWVSSNPAKALERMEYAAERRSAWSDRHAKGVGGPELHPARPSRWRSDQCPKSRAAYLPDRDGVDTYGSSHAHAEFGPVCHGRGGGATSPAPARWAWQEPAASGCTAHGGRCRLEDWLAIRPRVASKPEVESLFCTNRAQARPGGKPAGQMTSVTLLLLVRDLLVAAAKTAGEPLPARLGPQILRNTRLVMWLNEGVPASQVAVWAGLKNVKGLYHLREHLNPEIRITVKNVRDDED